MIFFRSPTTYEHTDNTKLWNFCCCSQAYFTVTHRENDNSFFQRFSKKNRDGKIHFWRIILLLTCEKCTKVGLTYFVGMIWNISMIVKCHSNRFYCTFRVIWHLHMHIWWLASFSSSNYFNDVLNRTEIEKQRRQQRQRQKHWNFILRLFSIKLFTSSLFARCAQVWIEYYIRMHICILYILCWLDWLIYRAYTHILCIIVTKCWINKLQLRNSPVNSNHFVNIQCVLLLSQLLLFFQDFHIKYIVSSVCLFICTYGCFSMQKRRCNSAIANIIAIIIFIPPRFETRKLKINSRF